MFLSSRQHSTAATVVSLLVLSMGVLCGSFCFLFAQEVDGPSQSDLLSFFRRHAKVVKQTCPRASSPNHSATCYLCGGDGLLDRGNDAYN